MAADTWGGHVVDGRMGFVGPNTGSDIRGYAFSIDTFLTAMPLVQLTAALAADFDGNGLIDEVDLQIGQRAIGLTAAGGADSDGDSDGKDFLTWQRQFQATATHAAVVPEPGSIVTALVMLTAVSSVGGYSRS